MVKAMRPRAPRRASQITASLDIWTGSEEAKVREDEEVGWANDVVAEVVAMGVCVLNHLGSGRYRGFLKYYVRVCSARREELEHKI